MRRLKPKAKTKRRRCGSKARTLHGIKYSLPVASAQLKSALLFAGLFAKGKTTVQEPIPTRNHTELMLNYFLVRTHKDEDGVSVFGDQVPESRDFSIPGDISSAAFWLVAAAAQPGRSLLVRDVGLNETRTGLLGVLVRMGAQVREAIEDVDQVEPRGILEITGARLKATVIQGKEVPQLIDELPILAVAGALANGTTIIRHAQELRVKETDRIAAIAHNLRSMGAQVVELTRRPRDPWSRPAPWRAPFQFRRSSHRDGVCGCGHVRGRRDRYSGCRLRRDLLPGLRKNVKRACQSEKLSHHHAGHQFAVALSPGGRLAGRCRSCDALDDRAQDHRDRRSGRLGQEQRRPGTGAPARLRLRQLWRDVSRNDLAGARTRYSAHRRCRRSGNSPSTLPSPASYAIVDSFILIDGVDPEPFLREDRVNENVSLVSSVPRVREILVDHLRRYGRGRTIS